MSDDDPNDLAEILLQFTNHIMNERVRSYNKGFDAGRKAALPVRPEAPAGVRPQPAIDNLTSYQVQCDMDGVMVQVSRQALDEVLAYLALTPAIGGLMQ